MAGFLGFTRTVINLDDPVFRKRVRKLEDKLKSSYNCREIHGGWECTPKSTLEPGFVVTTDTVLHVLRFFDL